MNNLYMKLAFHNIRKNKNTFMPFCITCTTMTAMFYMLNSIASNIVDGSFYGATTIRAMLGLGQVVCAIIAVVVIFYTNSFLMKRRTKELGLYSVLGLEKKHIRRVLFWEIIQIGMFSTALGLLLGIIFTKVGFLILLNLIGIQSKIEYHLIPQDILYTLALFAGTYVGVILYNGFRMFFLKPIDLLKSYNTGEKEPKLKLISAILGFICLGIGYYIAIATENVIDAISLFFVAVLFVIAGTYLLFTSGSIALLKLLKKNKKYYYHKTHFITVSGMIYRMKQNAVGLATICILSTMVLVTLSTTFSLYVGAEDEIRNVYPRDVTIQAYAEYAELPDRGYVLYEGDVPDAEAAAPEQSTMQYLILNNDPQIIQETTARIAEKMNVSMVDPKAYYTVNSTGILMNGEVTNYYYDGGEVITDINGYTLQGFESFAEGEYEELEPLQKGEVYVYCMNPSVIPELEKVLAREELTVKAVLDEVPDRLQEQVNGQGYIGYEGAVVVTSDVDELGRLGKAIARTTNSGDLMYYNVDFCYEFDLRGDRDAVRAYSEKCTTALYEAQANHLSGMNYYYENRDEMLMLYGSLFFIGIFLGMLFLMTTVLIIYYKQITEGYDDRTRFTIMENVGMSKREVKKVIRNQILTVFFLPILLAVTHICFAFNIIRRMMMALNLTNVPLFVLCTIGTVVVFCIIYAVVYSLTAKAYYRIVNSGNE